jgi:hypothetical protein
MLRIMIGTFEALRLKRLSLRGPTVLILQNEKPLGAVFFDEVGWVG